MPLFYVTSHYFNLPFRAWEQRKLGEESDVRDGTHDSPKYVNTGHPLVTSKNLKDFGLDFSDVSFISDEDFESINKRSKVDVGDILFGMIGTIGTPVQLIRKDFAIKNVALIKEKKNILNSFLIHLLKSAVFDRYIENENTGGTQKFLSLSKIRDFYFLSPKLEEQYQISLFFKQLDSTIALHQRKLEALKLMKKAFLQQMFPNNDEKVPRLRFADFDEEWDQRKLGDLGSVVMNRRIFKEETSYKGEIPFYKIGTFGGVADSYITRERFEDYKLKYPYPEKGDVLISASGSIGRAVEYNGEEAYYQDSNIVWLKHDKQLNNLFLKQFYSIVKWSGIEGTTIKRLYNKNILQTEIKVPCVDEQKKIGIFFKQLDNNITRYQSKLEKLSSLKKAYLQRMFI
ncbi:TPA: restriction endonuclease subunit S [Listeria innocua]